MSVVEPPGALTVGGFACLNDTRAVGAGGAAVVAPQPVSGLDDCLQAWIAYHCSKGFTKFFFVKVQKVRSRLYRSQ